MAKITLEEKISKLQNSIKKEEQIILISSQKVKEFKKELRELLAEKDKQYANDIIALMSENGFTSDEDKREFLNMIKDQFKK